MDQSRRGFFRDSTDGKYWEKKSLENWELFLQYQKNKSQAAILRTDLQISRLQSQIVKITTRHLPSDNELFKQKGAANKS